MFDRVEPWPQGPKSGQAGLALIVPSRPWPGRAYVWPNLPTETVLIQTTPLKIVRFICSNCPRLGLSKLKSKTATA